MELEELQVILSAKIKNFDESIAAIKNKLTGLNKAIEKNNKNLSIDINIEDVEKKIDDVTKKTESKLKSALKRIQSSTEKIKNSVVKSVGNISLPKFISQVDVPKSTDVQSKASPRAPPVQSFNTEKINAQMANLTETLDNLNTRIDVQKEKLAGLRKAYDMAFNPEAKNKLQDKILRTEASINGMIGKSDRLGFKLAELDEKLSGAGNEGKRTSKKLNDLGNSTKKISENTRSLGNRISRLIPKLKLFGSASKSAGKNVRGMNYGIGMVMKQMMLWMLILPAIASGIKALGTGLLNNLKTNQQFATSLAQIQTNLMVAFTPIYQAILPAINALMSALAKATAYIASFISALFGKTYQQSYQATQQLIDAKDAMGAYGDSAKKAAKEIKGLAGIDEINNLGSTGGDDSGSDAPTLTQPGLDMSAVDGETVSWAEKFKKVLSDLFTPMKQAWDKEGKATMDALKYALSEIWQLIKDIGKSFMEVWTNGTGQKVCENILRVLQTIFKVIGDIAKAFDIAWKKNNLGTKLIQDIFNSLNSVLELLIDIGETFRNVWNDGIGIEICTNILQILDNIAVIIGQIATSFKNAWDGGLGVQIVTDILNLLNGCLRIIQDITASFSKAWESNGDTICEGILLILDDIFGTLGDIANAWANAWEDNGNGDALMNSLLELLGKIFTTIGDIGQGMRESIGNVAEDVFGAVIQFCTDVSNGLGYITDGFKTIWDNGGQHLFDGIVNLTAEVGELILKITGGAFKDASGIFKDVLAPAIGEVFDVVGTLVDKLAEFTDWINNNKPLIDILSAALAGIGTALAAAKVISLLGEAAGALVTFGKAMSFVFSGGLLSGIADLGGALVAAVGGWPIIIGAAIVAIGVVIYKNWDEISAWLSNAWQWISDTCAQIWGGIKDFFSETWEGIKNNCEETWNNITTAISDKWGEVKQGTEDTWDNLTNWLGETWEGVKNTCSETWESMKSTISTKWEEVKSSTEEKWSGITSWLGTTWDTMSTTASTKWEEIKVSISGKWDELKAKCSEIWGNIQTDFDNIITWVKTVFTTGWSNAWNGIKNIFKTIFNSLVGIAKKPLNLVIAMVNKVIDGVNTMIKALNSIHIDIPDCIPGIGGESFGFDFDTISPIPALAKGGIVDSPTLAMVGEAGKEAVMPLENNTGWISDLASQIASILGTGNNSVSTQSDSGDIVFMLDSGIIGRVALNELIKMRKQGKNVIKLIT